LAKRDSNKITHLYTSVVKASARQNLSKVSSNPSPTQ